MSTKRKKAIYGAKELEKDIGELTFGNMLESYRLAEEMSQREFAGFLEISPSSLCDLEKGRKIPSLSRVLCITNKLGVSKKLWIQTFIQDQLKRESLDYYVFLEDEAV
jgi:transcriptional regulator with XRE-family HTH domain